MRRIVSLTVCLTIVVLAMASLATAEVPTRMHYQGYLTDTDGAPLDTTIAMIFTIYDDSTGEGIVWDEEQPSVVVSNGLFNVLLGSVNALVDTVFADTARWLGITVGSDPEITPRTRLVTVPYTFRVATVDGASGGVISGDVDIQSDLTVSGKATIGPGHTNTGANAFVAGESNTASGDNATVGGGYADTASGHRSTVGGGWDNTASGDNSTVGGGISNTASGERSTVGGGWENTASGDNSTVGGGSDNVASGFSSTVGGGENNSADSTFATVGGGWNNTASGDKSTVGGGSDNVASVFGSTVGGGWVNTASGNQSTVGGGSDNVASEFGSTVGGGWDNTASGDNSTVGGGSDNVSSGTRSTVGGGWANTASGDYSTVGGGRNNSNAGDNSAIPGGYADTLTSISDYSMVFGNQIYVNNSYRVVFFNGTSSGYLGINRDDRDGGIDYPIHVGTGTENGNGAHLTAGGTWQNGSSRTFKENFQPLGHQELLAKISSLPVEAWQYKESDERHFGPVSEDFVAAFDVGTVREDGTRDNKYLAASDVAGVALAGVKELAQQNQELRQIIEELRQRIEELEKVKTLR